MVSWSLVASLQAFLSGKSSFYACRALLGLIEGGFIPGEQPPLRLMRIADLFCLDCILYLSYFYTKNELPVRLAWFWVSNYLSHIVGAFLATGILRLRHTTGTAGWRYLFLIEGVFTLVVGLFSFLLMPPGPTQTRAKWRPKGWFDERCVGFPSRCCYLH